MEGRSPFLSKLVSGFVPALPVGGSAGDDGLVGLENGGISQVAGHCVVVVCMMGMGLVKEENDFPTWVGMQVKQVRKAKKKR